MVAAEGEVTRSGDLPGDAKITRQVEKDTRCIEYHAAAPIRAGAMDGDAEGAQGLGLGLGRTKARRG